MKKYLPLIFLVILISFVAGYIFWNKRDNVTKKNNKNKEFFANYKYNYKKENGEIFYQNKKIPDVDFATFEEIKNLNNIPIFKDKNDVYFLNGQKISFADPKTFQAIEGNYFRDKEHIFFWGSDLRPNIVMLTDYTKNFKIFKDTTYSKNDRSVFYNNLELVDANTRTFKAIDKNFAKDKNFIFYKENIAGTGKNYLNFLQKLENGDLNSGTKENPIIIEDLDIMYADFSKSGFWKKKLEFKNIIFRNCRFINTIFENATFENIRFEKCVFGNKNYDYYSAHNTEFLFSEFKDVNFENCTFGNEDKQIIFKKTEFKEINFIARKLSNPYFFNVGFSESVIENINFNNINGKHLFFHYSKIKNMKIENIKTESLSYSDSNLEKIIVEKSSFKRLVLRRAKIKDASIKLEREIEKMNIFYCNIKDSFIEIEKINEVIGILSFFENFKFYNTEVNTIDLRANVSKNTTFNEIKIQKNINVKNADLKSLIIKNSTLSKEAKVEFDQDTEFGENYSFFKISEEENKELLKYQEHKQKEQNFEAEKESQVEKIETEKKYRIYEIKKHNIRLKLPKGYGTISEMDGSFHEELYDEPFILGRDNSIEEEYFYFEIFDDDNLNRESGTSLIDSFLHSRIYVNYESDTSLVSSKKVGNQEFVVSPSEYENEKNYKYYLLEKNDTLFAFKINDKKSEHLEIIKTLEFFKNEKIK